MPKAKIIKPVNTVMRTVSIKLKTDLIQIAKLQNLQTEYTHACNQLVQFVVANRCWNRVALHNIAYSSIRKNTKLGSQMVCNSIYSVCKAYKAQQALKRIYKDKPLPIITFKNSSVHFDKRTYTIMDKQITLYTLDKRILVNMILGKHQLNLLQSGAPKEAELVCKKGHWFFNLVLEQQVQAQTTIMPIKTLGVDVGENNIAAISSNIIFGAGPLKFKRDCYLALRKRLQSNGSKSAKTLLRKVSGKEKRNVTHTNHCISKQIVQNALSNNATDIIMENLTNIRSNIKAGRRVRSRLHRWSFRQLQSFIEYKAKAHSINVLYVHPAYTSKTCSSCHKLGNRHMHLFKCKWCGFQAHADYNASLNLAWIGNGNTLTKGNSKFALCG